MIANLSRLPDIIAIQETWFQEGLTQLYSIPGFSSVHCCRGDGYGGTSVYIAEKLKFSVEYCGSSNFVDLILISFENLRIGAKNLKLISLYRSQKCSESNFFNIVEEVISPIVNKPLILLGDTNIDQFRGPKFDEFKDILLNYDCRSCHQLVTRPKSKSCIDHVFSNIYDKICIDSVECNLTDHNIICCKVKGNFIPSKYIEKKRKYCDISKVKEHLQKNLLSNSENVDDCVKDLISITSKAITEATVDVNCKKRVQFDMTPWVNINLQNLILYKEKLLKRRRKSKNEECNTILKSISKIIKKADKLSREFYYYDNLRKTGKDQKRTWSFLNSILGRDGRQEINIISESGVKLSSDQEKV